MAFKSERQRRYLWATNPELARQWTRKYGSRPNAANAAKRALKKKESK